MKFIINGGKKLSGEITLAGAKNAATKLMVTSLLTDEMCVLKHCPDIGDVAITSELCELVGSTVTRSNGALTLHTPIISNARVTSLSRKNRIPVIALGPLLVRYGTAEIPFLAGDKIGSRPVDMHLTALRDMGATIEEEDGYYRAEAKDGLYGATISLRYPSVGATENIILAATLAKGQTVITNAAIEPEIIDVVTMLQKMGAIIEFGANRTIYIDGVKKLHGAEHVVMPDRNEAVSFACLAVATGGEVFVRGARQEHLITFLNALRRVGGEYAIEESGIRFSRKNGLKSINLETDTHPGFMTDWQQPFTILLTQADGTSTIHETVYEDRFSYIADLNLMGAKIRVTSQCLGDVSCRFAGQEHPHSITIEGGTKLVGQELYVPDLRAGIAHVIAALIAQGESHIEGIEEIDRGYENIDERLRALGADITRSK